MTAAYIHLSATEPTMIRPHQSLFRFTADVALEQGHFSPRNDLLPVPTGPGLGVSLDPVAVQRMHEHFLTHGAMGGISDGSYRSRYQRV
jgi:glucarate dehydratase